MIPRDNLDTWTAPPGWMLRYRPLTGSTNDDAKQAARSGCPGRTIFLANEQTAGRGRHGRAWVAPPGSCLLLSLLLREPLPPIEATALCSVAIVEAIQTGTGLAARIKWPNDVMIQSRKVCGVLTEVVHADSDGAVVVGVGLNVNLDVTGAGIPLTATSLQAELGRPVSRAAMLGAILKGIDGYLECATVGPDSPIHERWEQLLWRRRQEIRLADGETMIEGTVEGIAPSGALRLRMANDQVREFQTGELLVD